MISRRLFLGGAVATPPAAVPLLRTFLHDIDLELDPAVVELQEGDVLVVRVPERFETSQAELDGIRDQLRRDVWPDVLLVPAGVEFQAIRRGPSQDEIDEANYNNSLNFLELKRR